MSGGEDRTTRVVVACDGAAVPPLWRHLPWPVLPIRTRGAGEDLRLRVEGLGAKIVGRLDRRANDLVRIASYAFAADQLVSRGGKGDPSRWRWRRELALVVPVADPDFWGEPATERALAEALGFGTEDRWSFAFVPAPAEGGQLTLDLGPEVDGRVFLGEPDSVALLSGGTDSLCAVVDAVAGRGMRPLLVSHRTGPHVDGPQRALARALVATPGGWAFPQMSFWVHLRTREAVARTRRTRGFLVAALGAAVAGQIAVPTVLLPDNGYVSLNPPVNAQGIGALNSRGTHPEFLRLVNRLVGRVFPAGVVVENPLAHRTRAEALRVLAEHGCAGLLAETRSCGHSRRPGDAPHCGLCSQCVDRRFAAIAAGLEAHDPVGGYGVELFTAPLPPGEGKTFAVSYVGFAQRTEGMGAEDLFLAYPQLEQCLDADAPGIAADAGALGGVLARHAAEVLGVVGTMVARHHGDFARPHRLPADCLLRLATGPEPAAVPAIEDDGPPPTGLAPDPPVTIPVAEAVELAAVADSRREQAAERRLQHVGKSWLVTFEGAKELVDHSVGMTRLARLLKAAGQDYLALDLVAWSVPGRDAPGRGDDGGPPRDPDALRRDEPGDHDPVLDAAARKDLGDRVAELSERRAEADETGDDAEASRIEAEMEAITNLVLAAKGKRGKTRSVPEDNEKARQTVSHTVAKARAAIAAKIPELDAHLDDALHLGIRCRYDPRPRVTWDVEL